MDAKDCLFCKIGRGEIPAKKVYEDADVLAFLDINPANKGHTLVIPKKHAENIFDSDAESLQKVIIQVQRIARDLKDKLGAHGVNVIQNNGQVAGQIVNHVHFHVIPRVTGDKVVITYQRAQIEEKEFDEIVVKLKSESSTAKAPSKSTSPKDFDFDF